MTALTAGWNRADRGGTGVAKPRRRPGISATERRLFDAIVNNRPTVPPGCLMVEQRDSAGCAA